MTRVERRPLLGRRRPVPGERSRLAGAARAVAAAVLTVLAGLVLAALVPQAVGFSAHVVTSGSMAPRIEPGDVVLTRATTAGELRVGQVLLVADPQRPGGLLLHRLVSFDPAGDLVTRGDANQSADSAHVAPSAVRGVAQLRVPWVGLPSVWRTQGRPGLIALVAVALAGAAVFVSRGLPRRGAADADPRAAGAAHGSSAGTRPPKTEGHGSAVRRDGDTGVIDRGVSAGTRGTEEKRGSATTAGYSLPPVPPAVRRPAPRPAGPARAAGPAGRGHRPGGDHSRCFDGGRLCGQPRR
jgi:signal peptidase